MPNDILLLLMLVTFFAGFVDAIAGGGGLITVPALMLAGLSPAQAIATNKAQATLGVGLSAYTFYRAGKIPLKSLPFPLFCASLGAIAGGFAVQYIAQDFLKTVLPFVLIVVAGYFAFSPFLKLQEKAKMNLQSFALFAVLPIGFYDGFFGPGAGSFLLLACTSLLGKSLSEGVGFTKALNFASNFASLMIFLFSGAIVWAVAGTMLIGQLAGSYLGTKAALKFEAKLIRPLVIIVCLTLSCKLLFF